MAKQESIGFNTQDTLRWKQVLRGAYATNGVFEVLVHSKSTQLCITVSQSSYSTKKPSGAKEPVNLSNHFVQHLHLNGAIIHVNST